MREIKFKVWDKKEKRIKLVLAVEWDTDNPDLLHEIHTYPIAIYRAREPKTRALEDIELMEFTGLFDKNGKEIYEGDILNFKWEKKVPSGGYICGSFDFYPETARVVTFNADEGAYWLEIASLADAFRRNYDWVVVGNIYENPELLNSPALPE